MPPSYRPLALPRANHEPLHGFALSPIPQAMRPAPAAKTSFTHAITVISLTAAFKGTDQAVRNAMWQCLTNIKPQHYAALLSMLNAPSPLAHVRKYLETLPAHLLRQSSPVVTSVALRQAARTAA